MLSSLFMTQRLFQGIAVAADMWRSSGALASLHATAGNRVILAGLDLKLIRTNR